MGNYLSYQQCEDEYSHQPAPGHEHVFKLVPRFRILPDGRRRFRGEVKAPDVPGKTGTMKFRSENFGDSKYLRISPFFEHPIVGTEAFPGGEGVVGTSI